MVRLRYSWIYEASQELAYSLGIPAQIEFQFPLFTLPGFDHSFMAYSAWLHSLLKCRLLLSLSAVALGAAPFELKDGDRVAFLGDTFFERAVRYGHIETALTARWLDRDVIFRNIGWAGDNARGRARVFFDPEEKGFENLQRHLSMVDPSVVLLSYGAMDSFRGKEGLNAFIQSMGTLVDAIEEIEAQVVILSPTPREFFGDILPNAEAQNENVALYTEALRQLAQKRDVWFVDLFNTLETRSPGSAQRPITDNGVHLNEYGYLLAAERIAQVLAAYSSTKQLSIGSDSEAESSFGVELLSVTQAKTSVTIRLRDERLSLSPLGGDHSQNLKLRLANLPPGDYRLEHSSRELASGSSEMWQEGIQLAWEPSNDQVVELRDAIKEKNELFFHQWRPQNETYLRGFRKYEQGQNAAEIEELNKPIEKAEGNIAKLRAPKAYSLVFRRIERETE